MCNFFKSTVIRKSLADPESYGEAFAGEYGGKESFYRRNYCFANTKAWQRCTQAIMAEGEEHIELKFRIYDGTDIAHSTYPKSTTVGTVKQRLVAEWPQDKTVAPKAVSDVKLIHAGKVLENSKTLADSRISLGYVPGEVITMHVVVQPPLAKKKTENNEEDEKRTLCSCAIL